MTNREKIIVGMMCATIAYGAYELLSSGSSQKTASVAQDNPAEEIRKLVADISKDLAGQQVSLNQQYLVESAAANWTKDPFIQSLQPLSATLASQAKPVEKPAELPGKEMGRDMLYSGFLQIGEVKLAIINGIEYAEGEALGITGYYVRRISAQRVVISEVHGANTIRLPLQEVTD